MRKVTRGGRYEFAGGGDDVAGRNVASDARLGPDGASDHDVVDGEAEAT